MEICNGRSTLASRTALHARPFKSLTEATRMGLGGRGKRSFAVPQRDKPMALVRKCML